MSSWLEYDLEVLASDPNELTLIAAELRKPSSELLKWIPELFGESLSIEAVKELLNFQLVENSTSVRSAQTGAENVSPVI